jgi:hypothetical protein
MQFIYGVALAVTLTGSLAVNNIEYVAEAKVVEPSVEWTEERIKEAIRETFPEQPDLLVRVASCESSFLPDAYNPKNGSHDGGVFQISEKYHGERLKELGLNPYDVRDNLAYARLLYEESGLKPWAASKRCWSR